MAFFDKETLRKSIAPKVTSVYQVLKFDRYPYEVLLSDIMQRPPVDVWVDVSPVYVAQVRQWQPGTVIRATIQSEVFTGCFIFQLTVSSTPLAVVAWRSYD